MVFVLSVSKAEQLIWGANSSHLCLLVCKQMLRPINSVALNNVLVYLPIALVMESTLSNVCTTVPAFIPRTHIKRAGTMADPNTREVETGEAQ